MEKKEKLVIDLDSRWIEFTLSEEYADELYKKKKKYLHDPDNHYGMITHLEPDILECEVKWAFGSISTNKTSEGDGILQSYFKS